MMLLSKDLQEVESLEVEAARSVGDNAGTRFGRDTVAHANVTR